MLRRLHPKEWGWAHAHTQNLCCLLCLFSCALPRLQGNGDSPLFIEREATVLPESFPEQQQQQEPAQSQDGEVSACAEELFCLLLSHAFPPSPDTGTGGHQQDGVWVMGWGNVPGKGLCCD